MDRHNIKSSANYKKVLEENILKQGSKQANKQINKHTRFDVTRNYITQNIRIVKKKLRGL
jgi:hypothetical protein